MGWWSKLLSFYLPANHGTIHKVIIPAMESQFSLLDSILNPWKCQQICQRCVYGFLCIQNLLHWVQHLSLSSSELRYWSAKFEGERQLGRRDFTCSQKRHWSVIGLPAISFRVRSLADIPIFIQLPMKSLQWQQECKNMLMLKHP
jgi:hypothetical protein